MVTVKQDDDRKKDNRIQVSLHENLHEKVIINTRTLFKVYSKFLSQIFS